MYKKTLIFCFCLAFSTFAKATTLTLRQGDTLIPTLILLRNGDTLKVCNAKNAEKDIEFCYCNNPKQVKVINKIQVLRVIDANNDVFYQKEELKGVVLKPRLFITRDLFGGYYFHSGNKDVNPYVFDGLLVPQVKNGEARRQKAHVLFSKARTTSHWNFAIFFTTALLGLFTPVGWVIGAAALLTLSILQLAYQNAANQEYYKMVDEYNAGQGYNVD